MTAALECRGLVKTFGQVRALDGIDLVVQPGEVVGFLGPNGAGKSTTIRAVLGQLRLDSGAAAIFGHDAWSAPVRAHERIAYVPGDVTLWPGLTGGECIDLLGALQGRPNPGRRTELIERFDLDAGKRTRTYSKGNKQKVGLIAALSTDADLLLLDEPTSGLDPLMEAEFQAVVRERVDQGAAVLLSSHIMSEVEALCERVSIIRSGRIVHDGTLAGLRSESTSTIDFTAADGTEVRGWDDVAVVAERATPRGVHLVLRVDPERLTEVLERVLRLGPTALTVQPPSLDELFRQHYERETEPVGAEG
ncbi:ABC transporter ATP-binding protein [Nocardioides hungaricus]